MNTADINERLARLERRSRFQQATIAVLTLGIAALIWMAAAPPLHVLRAGGLQIIDPATGKVTVRIASWGLAVVDPTTGKVTVQVASIKHRGSLAIDGAGDLMRITPNSVGSHGKSGLLSLSGSGFTFLRRGALAQLSVGGANAPSLDLLSGGFEMDLGGTNTKGVITGSVTSTTVDSIVMFGNDKKHLVIWRAP